MVAVLGAGLVTNAMLTRSQLPRQPQPATAEIYVMPDAQSPDATPEIRQAVPLPAAEEAPKPEAVAAIPPKPQAKPLAKSSAPRAARPDDAARSCEADDCVSWETTVTKALAAPPAPRPEQPRVLSTREIEQPMTRGISPPLDIATPDENLGPIEREPSSVGGMAKSAASTVVTQSEKLVDNVMRWSDSAVSKFTSPPRWISSSGDPNGP
ncbi:hypothetical protein [Kaistia terrae]|uniref:Uncharacterized protein n=1 Tax=Kaistia terrae TaxID=537017 RepID=A0ABW0PTE6_9HYPH|nr:hypothetical protein [Kaistia terrae]MCX5577632.1 hypothetical protein [Kaistia terrae]